jgi:hypothetical protein
MKSKEEIEMGSNQGQLNRAERRHNLSAHPSVDGTTTIMLDRERHMRCDFDVIEAFQADTGINVLEGVPFLKPPDVVLIGKFVYHCLRPEDPDITLPEVRKMLGLHNMWQVVETISQLYMSSIPKEVQDALRPLVMNPSPSLVGEPSGPLDGTTSGSVSPISGDAPGGSSVAS